MKSYKKSKGVKRFKRERKTKSFKPIARTGSFPVSLINKVQIATRIMSSNYSVRTLVYPVIGKYASVGSLCLISTDNEVEATVYDGDRYDIAVFKPCHKTKTLVFDRLLFK